MPEGRYLDVRIGLSELLERSLAIALRTQIVERPLRLGLQNHKLVAHTSQRAHQPSQEVRIPVAPVRSQRMREVCLAQLTQHARCTPHHHAAYSSANSE